MHTPHGNTTSLPQRVAKVEVTRGQNVVVCPSRFMTASPECWKSTEGGQLYPPPQLIPHCREGWSQSCHPHWGFGALRGPARPTAAEEQLAKGGPRPPAWREQECSSRAKNSEPPPDSLTVSRAGEAVSHQRSSMDPQGLKTSIRRLSICFQSSKRHAPTVPEADRASQRRPPTRNHSSLKSAFSGSEQNP